MRSSTLLAALEPAADLGSVRGLIAPGMPEFRRGLSRRGGSAPVHVITEHRELRVTAAHVRALCSDYLAGRLDEQEVAYVATALELCPDFVAASPSVAEALPLLSDPVANGPLTADIVASVAATVSDS